MGTLIIQPKSWDFSNINTALWVTAADSSTVINTSGAIDQLSDKSGNNTHLTASGVNRPTYLTNTLNGKPVISFDGVNDRLQTNTWGLTGYTGLSIFLVAKWQTNMVWVGGDFNRLQVLVDNAHDNSAGFVIQDRPDLIGKPGSFATLPVAGGNGSGVLDTIQTGNNTWQTIGVTRTLGVNAKHSFYRNGQLISESANTANLSINSSLALGYWITGNGRFFRGQIAEVIITKYPFDTDTVSKAFGRLAHNWGLTANLPSNHPYKNSPP